MSEQTQVTNPFANAPVAAHPGGGELAAVTGSARETAEVQSMMVIARRFPRDEMAVMDRILQACTRPSLAEGALYEYARGGTDIRGPSIRLAECIAQYWGHLDFGWRVLEERPGATKVQAFAWDMQTGTRCQMVFDVVHERQAGGSRKTLHDPRDIYEHVANAASRRLRACVLRVVPGDVVEAAVKQCEKTLVTKLEVTPERLQTMLTQFADFGVTKGQIEKRLQRRLEAITPGMMAQLGKIFTSLRDGISTPGDWFAQTPPEGAAGSPGEPVSPPDPVPAPKGSAAVRQRLQARSKQEEPPQPTPGPEPVSDALREVVRFAKAAASKEDLERATNVALHITDEDEAVIAQEHIEAARERIG
jgi:hypothetical protein